MSTRTDPKEPVDPQRPTQAERDAAQKIVDTPVTTEHVEYPAWRYHKDGSSKIVRSTHEDSELGWSDVPIVDPITRPPADAPVPMPVTIVPPVPGQPGTPAEKIVEQKKK